MSKKYLRQEINRQVANINASRDEISIHSQSVKRKLSDPKVLTGGLITGFLVGFFLLSRRDKSSHQGASRKSNFTAKINTLQNLLSSPLILMVASLLKK